MPVAPKKAWRGVFRGHLKDVYITCGQLIRYGEAHQSATPQPFSPTELTALGSIRALMSAKLAQTK